MLDAEEEEEEEEAQEVGEGLKKTIMSTAPINVSQTEQEEYSNHHERKRKAKWWLRFVVLFFTAIIPFATYSSNDTVSACVPLIKDQFKFSTQDIAWLFAVSGVPNMILIPLMGMVSDAYGTVPAAIGFTISVALGTFLVALGPLVFEKPFVMMAAGRLFHGLGMFCLLMTHNKIVAEWFEGKEIGFGNAVCLSFARLGAVAGYNIAPLVAKRISLRAALLTGFGMSLLAPIGVVVLVFLYRFADQPLCPNFSSKSRTSSSGGGGFHLRAVRRFPLSYFILGVACMCAYSAVLTFTSIGSDFLHEKFGYSTAKASAMISLVPLVALFFAPFAGYVTDKVGIRQWILTLSLSLLLPAFLLLALTDLYPLYSILLMAAAMCAFPSALWPSVPLLIEPQMLGTALGLIFCVESFGMFATPALIGVLHRFPGGYDNGMVLLFALALLGIACGVALFFVPQAHILRAPSGSFTASDRLPSAPLDSDDDKRSLVERREKQSTDVELLTTTTTTTSANSDP